MDDGIVYDPVFSEVQIGHINGLDFLYEESRRHILINDIEKSINRIDSISDSSGQVQLKEAANLCGSIINQVEHHKKVISKGFILLNKSNLIQLSEIDLSPKEKKQLSRLINKIAIE
jgi:hypothetical protein